MDEIGLLLTWGDYYSSATYLLSLFLIGIFLNIIFFPSFWYEVRDSIFDASKANWAWNILFKFDSKVVEAVSEKSERTEKVSLFFTGTIFILAGVLILLFPRFVYYWVAGGFLFQGVSSLVRAWEKD